MSAFFDDAEMCDSMRYLNDTNDPEFAVLWTFSLVRRGAKALSYRIGRYRDDREGFANKRTIGFPGVVTASDRTLFSQNDYGAADNAFAVLLLDLDLSSQSFDKGDVSRPETRFLLEADGADGVSVALLVLEWTCPVWFEPTTLRLSLNDPCWMDVSVAPNNPDDFEPWSRSTLRRVAEHDF